MGEKYELRFLCNMDKKNILMNIVLIMEKYNWLYNIYDYGQYSYWVESPIWNFEKSVEIIESEKNNPNNISKIETIINNISEFYSQTIFLNKIISGKISTSIIAIVESTVDIHWKDVLVAFEYTDISCNSYVINEIKDIFVNISKKINPYYAISALEMAGLVDIPEKLVISNEMLGDFNFFSYNCINSNQINVFTQTYDIIDYNNIGFFIFSHNN